MLLTTTNHSRFSEKNLWPILKCLLPFCATFLSFFLTLWNAPFEEQSFFWSIMSMNQVISGTTSFNEKNAINSDVFRRKKPSIDEKSSISSHFGSNCLLAFFSHGGSTGAQELKCCERLLIGHFLKSLSWALIIISH